MVASNNNNNFGAILGIMTAFVITIFTSLAILISDKEIDSDIKVIIISIMGAISLFTIIFIFILIFKTHKKDSFPPYNSSKDKEVEKDII